MERKREKEEDTGELPWMTDGADQGAGEEGGIGREEESNFEEMAPEGGAKKGAKKGKGGGFQTMGLSRAVLRGVLEKGYRVPTPIQRKVIPVALKGKDVVAMARTGSGKTAAFLVPMLQRLQAHAPLGIRALVLSPTRDLAIQTLKFSRAIGKHTDLQQTLVVGGDGLESQFAALGAAPDVVIATPGRLWHLIQEMSLSLASVEMVVFDEADRLFEMGFAEQLRLILKMLPDSRQTLLVSATLPAALAQFAKAGLRDPEMVRLDIDTRLSPDLQNVFVALAASEKAASLAHVLINCIGKGVDPSKGDTVKTTTTSETTSTTETTSKSGDDGHGDDGDEKKQQQKQQKQTQQQKKKGEKEKEKKQVQQQQAQQQGEQRETDKKLTMVFVSTKHHVEYLTLLLKALGVECVGIYGAMDQAARVRALAAFRRGDVPVMVVTDVAARGIDIPLLDYVVNYDFPAEPKLYVHRAGRVARAGRPGVAISFVAHDELPYAVDLMLYLGQDLHCARPGDAYDSRTCVLGTLPRTPVEHYVGEVSATLTLRLEIALAFRSMTNATKKYTKTRPLPSAASVRRAKDMSAPAVHPYFAEHFASTAEAETEARRRALLDSIRAFRPKATVFEISNVERTAATEAMENARREMAPSIARFHRHMDEVREEEAERERRRTAGRDDFDGMDDGDKSEEKKEEEEEEEKKQKHHTRKGKVIGGHARKSAAELRKEEQQKHFLSALPPPNHDYEKALEIKSDAVNNAVFGLTMDDDEGMQKEKTVRKWDRRKKKYVLEHGGVEARTGSFNKTEKGAQGVLPDGSMYQKWLRRTKGGHAAPAEGSEGAAGAGDEATGEPRAKKARKGTKSELKSFEQIRKVHMKEAWRKKSRAEKMQSRARRAGPAIPIRPRDGTLLRGGKGRRQH